MSVEGTFFSAPRVDVLALGAAWISLVIGWALLGEAPPALAVLGGAICLVGVVVARRPARDCPEPRDSPVVRDSP